MPERQLRQRIRQALRSAFPGALVLGWPSNLWTGAGWPDLLFSEWPLLVGFEVKQGRYSHPTPLQASRHVELRKHHVPVYVVYGPDDAVHIIHTLKEKLPMAFDPSLLAELDAALSDAPAEPTNGSVLEPSAAEALEELPVFEVSDADLPTPAELKLDADAPAPDIEDIVDAIVIEAEVAHEDAQEALAVEALQINVLIALKNSVDALAEAVNRLVVDIDPSDTMAVPQTAEAPAPRRRSRRS